MLTDTQTLNQPVSAVPVTSFAQRKAMLQQKLVEWVAVDDGLRRGWLNQWLLPEDQRAVPLERQLLSMTLAIMTDLSKSDPAFIVSMTGMRHNDWRDAVFNAFNQHCLRMFLDKSGVATDGYEFGASNHGTFGLTIAKPVEGATVEDYEFVNQFDDYDYRDEVVIFFTPDWENPANCLLNVMIQLEIDHARQVEENALMLEDALKKGTK